MRKKLLFTIFIIASAGSLYGQGWTFNDGTLNVTSQIWVRSYEFGNTHPSTYNGTPYSEYHNQIKTIILADNITYVGQGAFKGCTVAERLVVGKGVKNFAYNAFYFPKSTLKTIEWNAANAGLVDQYDGYMSKYNQGPFGVREVWMEIDDYNYAANAETIIFGPDVVSIPDYFAYFMKKLKKVEFGAKVTSIGIQAFVEITPNTVLIARMPNPSSVTLGNTYYNPFPASASDRNKITLKVPAEYINQYKAANIWKDFNIVALENSTEDEPSETQTGVLVGAFSVSSTRKVHFSRGNLQYQASTKKWRFALNQYNYIGSANSNISSTYSGWIDLFGYGTSGWNSGFYAYRPYASDSYDGSYINKDLTGAYANADWGVYNAISNGGNQAGLWRTLTGTEWKYLLRERPNADIRLSVGKVNSVSGLILLPDDWVLPEGLTFTPKGSSYDSNKYNTTQWQKMENAGAVFLPAAGWRVIDEVRTTWSSGGIGLRGCYHGATIVDPSASTKKNYFLTFYSDKFGMGGNARECGLSVRLVQDVLGYTITFVDADGNTIGTPQVVEPGQSATPPTPPTRADYNFAGWIGNYQNVTADATIYASYEYNNHVLNGVFSVSETKSVQFSPGNLQYYATSGTHQCADGSTKPGTWRFAEHQYDMIAEGNTNISASYAGWIDLFGWGTSGWNSGANAYQPYSTSIVNSDYYPGGSIENSLTGAYQYADWGVYNAIYNGGNQPNQWRTITDKEMEYLYNGRANAADKRGQATVNNMTGYILLPDTWVTPDGLTFIPNACNYTTNTYTLSQWRQMELNGAVFLPSAGCRKGTAVYVVGTIGDYWTSIKDDATNARRMIQIRADDVLWTGDDGREERMYGFNVRLIKDVICHTITFEANGGVIPTGGNMGNTPSGHITTLSTDRTSGTVAVTSNLSYFSLMTGDCPTREGYSFTGWFTDPLVGEQVYDEIGWCVVGTYWNQDRKWIGTTDVQLYAHWLENPRYELLQGTLTGLFSISPSQKVLFSQGNLQYNTLGNHRCADGTTQRGTWRFAAHQYDTIGISQTQKANNYYGWVSAFGWGTSGWNSGANIYQPWACTGDNYQDYYPGGDPNNDLTGSYAFADWGVYNAITNGGNQPQSWRTLSRDEWEYLLRGRPNAANLSSRAIVNGIEGCLFLPDDFVLPAGMSFHPLVSQASDNSYSMSEWTILENLGAVFIPRDYTYSFSSGNGGWGPNSSLLCYTSSSRSYTAAYAIDINLASFHNRWKCDGGAVRLVHDALPYTITWQNADGSELEKDENVFYSSMPEYNGSTPTKPADAEYTYTFAGWSPAITAVIGDKTYIAIYTQTLRKYTITVATSSISQGTATGGGTYDYGTNHQITATPNECYRFVQWSDGNTDNPRTITVTGDATYTAEFEQIQYTIEALPDNPAQGSATVTNP